MRVYEQMHLPGVMLWMTGCARMFVTSDGIDFVFRWWHPVTILLIIFLTIPCAIAGERLFEAVPVQLPPKLQKHKQRIIWVTPFTKIPNQK